MQVEVLQTRFQGLTDALTGYEKTGMPLVGFRDGSFKQVAVADDPGIYVIIPKLAHIFNTSIQDTLTGFFLTLIALSFLLGLWGFFLQYKSNLARLVSFVGLFLFSCFTYRVGDVYIVSSTLAMAFLPLFLYFCKQKFSSPLFIFFIFTTGLAVGTSQFIRMHSGTGLLVFILIILVFYFQGPVRQKRVLIASGGLGFLIPFIVFNVLISQSNSFLEKKDPNYFKTSTQHTFWHSVYIGFGFLNTKLGIKYSDRFAYDKVKSISPDTRYLSEEYERILRGEVFKIIRKEPAIVAFTIFAKMGVIVLYLILFANIGLLAAWHYKKPLSLELAFWCAILFNSIFGILVIPSSTYLLGLAGFAAIYGITSINEALSAGLTNKISKLLLKNSKPAQ